MITIKDQNSVMWRLLENRRVNCDWWWLRNMTVNVNDKAFVTLHWIVPKGWLN